MTVIFSKKCELALQAVLYLSVFNDKTYFTATDISKRLNIPKEFLAKILQSLAVHSIVISKKGKTGGFTLGKPLNEIRLIDIVIAIDGLEIFHKCVLGFKGCTVEKPCPLHEKWGKLRDLVYKMLSEETLLEIRDKSVEKIKSIHSINNDALVLAQSFQKRRLN
ncbi:MAG: transcriptional regulator [Ignavibacteria bacterium GWB2_35_12]|nr:MAG: transcriptional regulator [Ignavibacteria bacterium GWA2_35_8]OGU41490.1 MAG: transcriptional regulator [Ignavibacteria bacterium GWB2_35_12]OGU92978.1 MAG: transcriptional regulator [Ignavibacteria bacterium RIFOXYA2_FULL_35_10]OGV22964.1 MAG: transcriptional regulator [Ignavibacteria bacterium RIFOXYC2_FULL_35_21]